MLCVYQRYILTNLFSTCRVLVVLKKQRANKIRADTVHNHTPDNAVLFDRRQDSRRECAITMTDIFDNKILCRKCNKEMQRENLQRNGFTLRTLACPLCNERIIHPNDEQEYNKFADLKNKEFQVKMRLVGNSHTVSIPKEIVSFIRNQEKIMGNMVKLCFEDFGRLSLNFGQPNQRVIKSREIRMMKNGKPILHTKQFYDSDQEKNKLYNKDDK